MFRLFFRGQTLNLNFCLTAQRISLPLLFMIQKTAKKFIRPAQLLCAGRRPAMSDFSMAFIIPVYNHGATLDGVITSLKEYSLPVIVVDDGNDEKNRAYIKAATEKHGEVILVTCEKNGGKGKAMNAGVRKAHELGFTHVFQIDADGQHFAEDIPLFINEMNKCCEAIIVGSRNLTEKNMPRQNTFANRFSNFWFRLQTSIDLPDTQSGYRLYALASLRWLRLITSRYEAELELLVFAAWAGVRIVSVPVRVYYPPADERVSHFRPVYDFVRISILNTILCLGALFYGYPRLLLRKITR